MFISYLRTKYLRLNIRTLKIFGMMLLLGLVLGSGISFMVRTLLDVDPAGLDSKNWSEKDILVYKLSLSLGHLCLFILPAFLFLQKIEPDFWKKKILPYRSSWHVAGIFLVILHLVLPIGLFFSELIQSFSWYSYFSSMDDDHQDKILQLIAMDGPLDILLNLIVIALIPAIGEELSFRAVGQRYLIHWLQHPHWGIIICSVFFAGIHLEPAGFFPKFFISLCLGYGYFLGKSIWIPIGLHFFNNGSLVLLYYFQSGSSESEIAEKVAPNLQTMALAALASTLLIYFIYQSSIKNLQHESGTENP